MEIPPYFSVVIMKRQFIVKSNADLEKTYSKYSSPAPPFYTDTEFKVRETRKHKLELCLNKIDASAFLNRTGTLEIFCERKNLKAVYVLLEKKLVPESGKLQMALMKAPSFISFDYVDLPLYIGLFNLLAVLLGLLHLPEIINWAIIVPWSIGTLTLYRHWRRLFP